MKEDLVNKPAHYQDALLGHEAIEVIEELLTKYRGHVNEEQLYLIGNMMKYILRATEKGNIEQDLKKAEWYLHRAISKFSKEEKVEW